LTFLHLFKRESMKRAALVSGHVVPDSTRCVQCGICTYNCPIGIDVRAHAWRGEAVVRSECLTCGECVARCPRGVLRFEHTDLFEGRGG
jgi:ferredoxin